MKTRHFNTNLRRMRFVGITGSVLAFVLRPLFVPEAHRKLARCVSVGTKPRSRILCLRRVANPFDTNIPPPCKNNRFPPCLQLTLSGRAVNPDAPHRANFHRASGTTSLSRRSGRRFGGFDLVVIFCLRTIAFEQLLDLIVRC